MTIPATALRLREDIDALVATHWQIVAALNELEAAALAAHAEVDDAMREPWFANSPAGDHATAQMDGYTEWADGIDNARREIEAILNALKDETPTAFTPTE